MRGKPPRSNCIDLDVVNSPFAGQVLGEADDSALAGVIPNRREFWRRAAESCDRRNIDDLPAALSDHGPARCLRTKKSSSQIGLDYLVPVLQGHLLRRGAPGNSRVIDQDVDPAELGEGRI